MMITYIYCLVTLNNSTQTSQLTQNVELWSTYVAYQDVLQPSGRKEVRGTCSIQHSHTDDAAF